MTSARSEHANELAVFDDGQLVHVVYGHELEGRQWSSRRAPRCTRVASVIAQ